mmetsp:Transcript_24900/g.34331  ORF Transcript_24900/g.34331 Transcript_24900/m.34331 type:complete len:550 (+) Transcript_24900:104-1753(+)
MADGSFGEIEQRLKSLETSFEQIYQCKPAWISIAPGRVNLIGEHIDYSDFGVLPMAIEHSSMMAFLVVEEKESKEEVSSSNSFGRKIFIHNKDDRFPSTEVEIPSPTTTTTQTPSSGDVNDGKTNNTYGVKFNRKKRSWHQFFLAGYVGVLQNLAPELGNLDPAQRDRLLFGGKGEKWFLFVEGNVPVGSGLASSSALVCASSLLTMHALRTLKSCPSSWKGFTKLQLGSITAKCEQYVGAESGGMDQAISLLGEQGIAKMIEFNPLRSTDVRMPSCSSFVLANSLKEHSVADSHYNLRVFECRLAVNILAKYLLLAKKEEDQLPSSSPSSPPPSRWKTMRELAIHMNLNTEEGLNEMASLASTYLKEGSYRIEEAAAELNMPIDSLVETYSPHFHPDEGVELELRLRAKHVFSEASRVFQFKRACDECQKEEMSEEVCMEKLGELMKQSHESCRDFYDCSCDELNRLVAISESLGARGARLTGAGWGGWGVILVSEEKAKQFINSLTDEYLLPSGVSPEEVSKNVVWSKPSAGARLYNVRSQEWVLLL